MWTHSKDGAILTMGSHTFILFWLIKTSVSVKTYESFQVFIYAFHPEDLFTFFFFSLKSFLFLFLLLCFLYFSNFPSHVVFFMLQHVFSSLCTIICLDKKVTVKSHIKSIKISIAPRNMFSGACPTTAYLDWSCESAGGGQMYFVIKLLSNGIPKLINRSQNEWAAQKHKTINNKNLAVAAQ